jgi:hypothetical protein
MAKELMTASEIHDFGTETVFNYLKEEGHEIVAVNTDLAMNPQIVATKNGELKYIIVRTACYPSKGKIENDQEASECFVRADKHGATCYFASVGIANADGADDAEMAIPVKGAPFHVSFNGLEILTSADRVKVWVGHDPQPGGAIMELTKIEALRAYARMINTLDASHIEPLLADDFHYASQWVLDEITSKQAFLDYIRGKLETIAQSESPAYAELAELHPSNGGGPCLVIAQGSKDNLMATVLVVVEDGYIKRFDMCCIPPPSAAARTGEYPA